MRFAFGKNWQRFLSLLNDERIQAAEESLRSLLDIEDLSGKTFLDIGCGSGLFSLAARRLGATVVSFDYDLDSVACCQELKTRYFPNDDKWRIEQGSILDESFLATLAPADIVYSWGVLHHTGQMWDALEKSAALVAPGGRLAISIYNDQGGASRRWRAIKKLYNAAPQPIPFLLVVGISFWTEFKQLMIRVVRFLFRLVCFKNPFSSREKQKRGRGMSYWHDLVDWVGGYPFEVAKPEEIFQFYHERGFELIRMTTQGNGYGCNEFAFRLKAD